MIDSTNIEHKTNEGHFLVKRVWKSTQDWIFVKIDERVERVCQSGKEVWRFKKVANKVAADRLVMVRGETLRNEKEKSCHKKGTE